MVVFSGGKEAEAGETYQKVILCILKDQVDVLIVWLYKNVV